MKKPCQDAWGNLFESKAEMARYYKLTPSALKDRLSRNIELEEALLTPMREKSDFDGLTIHGEYFKTYAEAGKKYNLGSKTLRYRIVEMHMTPEEAVSTRVTKQGSKGACINGIMYESLLEAYNQLNAAELGIIYKTFWDRYIHGKNPLQDYSMKKPCIVDGVKYQSEKAACDANNVDRSFVHYRCKYLQVSVEEAIKQEKIRSFGEYRIAECLSGLNVNFETEYIIKEFDTRARFDFAIKNNSEILLIEFDGKQHFAPFGFQSDLASNELIMIMKQTHNQDIKKAKFCEENGLPLLRIKYTQIRSIDKLINAFLNSPNMYITKHSQLKNYYDEYEKNIAAME